MRFQRGDIIPLIFVDDVVVHLEKDKRIYRKILELQSKFSNATESLSVCNSQLYSYTLATLTKEIKFILFTIASPKPQIARVNLIKNVQENIMREIK